MTKESPASLTPEERARRLWEELEYSYGEPHEEAKADLAMIADALRAAEARGRERGIEEAAREIEDTWLVKRENIARAVRRLSAEPQATPPSLPEQPEDRQTDRQEMATSPLEKIGTRNPDSAEVATLRLDVAWWQARLTAVELERQAAQSRAEAAEAEVVRLTRAACPHLECGKAPTHYGVSIMANAIDRHVARAEAAEAAIDVRDRNDNGLFMEAWRQRTRAEAAEAAQAKVRMAIGFLLSCIASGEKLSEGEEAEIRALTSAASAPQAPPEEVK